MVGSASGSGTGIMSSNVFSPIQILGFGLKQISQKKDSELFVKGFWTPRVIAAN
jgi:hypothetical protein